MLFKLHEISQRKFEMKKIQNSKIDTKREKRCLSSDDGDANDNGKDDGWSY